MSPREAALEELRRLISSSPLPQAITIHRQHSVTSLTIPATGDGEPEPVAVDVRQELTEAEAEVAWVLSAVAGDAGLQAKEVAAKMQPKGDVEVIAKRLFRMKKRQLAEQAGSGGYRLTELGRAAINLFSASDTQEN